MSEWIHAFGENGELSGGARLALDHFMAEEVNPAISDAVSQGGGGGGTTDHSALTNREAADQHPISAISGLEDALADLSDVVRTDDVRLSDPRPPTEHRHPWADLDDVPVIPSQPADIGAQPAGDYLTSADLPEPPDLSDVVREGDPRLADARDPNPHRHSWADLDDTPGIPSTPEDIGAQPAGDYLTPGDLPEPPDLSDVVRDDDPRLTDARTPVSHEHDINDVTGLQSALDGKADANHDHGGIYQPVGDYAAASHTHTIANVTGLQSALDDKLGSVTYADLPAGATLTVPYDDGWPARPTSRSDIRVWWVGGDDTRPSDALPGDVHLPDQGDLS